MDESPLDRLSSEIRNQIYEHVFRGNEVLLDRLGKHEVSNTAAALTRVCSRIRNESRLMLLAIAPIRLRSAAFIHNYPPFLEDTLDVAIMKAFGQAAVDILKGRVIHVDYRHGKVVRLCCAGCTSYGADTHGEEKRQILEEQILAAKDFTEERNQAMSDDGGDLGDTWVHRGWCCWTVG